MRKSKRNCNFKDISKGFKFFGRPYIDEAGNFDSCTAATE